MNILWIFYGSEFHICKKTIVLHQYNKHIQIHINISVNLNLITK